MNKICIMGGGSFGKAVYALLKEKGLSVSLWTRNDSAEAKISGSEAIVFAVPSQSFREVFTKALPFLRSDTLVIDLAKGIEKGSLLRLSEVAEELCPAVRYVALSGPSHAEEIVMGCPTTVAASSRDPQAAMDAQDLFMTDRFRVYTNDDLIGTELGSALKNIIALGAGICDGMELGDNAKAALMTRGIAEISRLGEAMGAKKETFFGLSGIGDLIVTCTSMHSRNRRCGILIGQGVPAKEAEARIGQVVESIATTDAAYALSRKYDVEMPITAAICGMLEGQLSVRDSVDLLMLRKRKAE